MKKLSAFSTDVLKAPRIIESKSPSYKPNGLNNILCISMYSGLSVSFANIFIIRCKKKNFQNDFTNQSAEEMGQIIFQKSNIVNFMSDLNIQIFKKLILKKGDLEFFCEWNLCHNNVNINKIIYRNQSMSEPKCCRCKIIVYWWIYIIFVFCPVSIFIRIQFQFFHQLFTYKKKYEV